MLRVHMNLVTVGGIARYWVSLDKGQNFVCASNVSYINFFTTYSSVTKTYSLSNSWKSEIFKMAG